MAKTLTGTAHCRPETVSDCPLKPRLKPLNLLLGLTLAAWGMPAAHATDTVADGFRIIPNASLTETWNDNIYGTPSAEKSDLITTLNAAVKANSNWKRHRLNLDAGGSADFYADHDAEDVVDWTLGADGRYDLTAKSHALGGIRFSQDHENRSSPDSAVGATDPTTYLTQHAHLGFAHQLAPFTIRLGGVVEKLDFDKGSTTGFDINLRDRAQYSIGTRFSYQLNPNREVFFQAATDTRDYDDTTAGRNSDGYRLGLGLRIKQGDNFDAEGFLGHASQDYDAIALKDVNTVYYGASLKWKPAAQTRVNAKLDRSINETTVTGASGVLETSIGGRLEHDLSSQFTLNAGLTFTNSDYQGASLELDAVSASVGARYYFDKNVYVSGGYRHTNRDANSATYEYDQNQIFLGLGYAPRTR